MKGFFFGGHAAFSDDMAQDDHPWRSARLIVPYLKRHALRISAGFLALILVDLFQLVIPRIIKKAVDALQLGAATPSLLLWYSGYIILIALFIAALRYIWRMLILGFSRILETSLRERLFSHILTLDKTFFQGSTTGNIMALATNDLSAVQLASGMGLVATVDAIFMGIGAICFMAYIHPVLTLIAILPMPILAYLTRFLSSRLHLRFKKVQEQFSILTEFARSTFSTVRLIKAYNQQRSQTERFNRMGETYVRDNLRLATIYGTLFPVSGLIANVSMLLVLLFGGRLTISGSISAGDFVAFISYLYLMTWPMMALGWVADLFQRGMTSLRRIETLLLEK
ncbi:MAG: ABC transporter transmembrane domain-containing protein, partial [Syntrophobacteraceae bacterium]